MVHHRRTSTVRRRAAAVRTGRSPRRPAAARRVVPVAGRTPSAPARRGAAPYSSSAGARAGRGRGGKTTTRVGDRPFGIARHPCGTPCGILRYDGAAGRRHRGVRIEKGDVCGDELRHDALVVVDDGHMIPVREPRLRPTKGLPPGRSPGCAGETPETRGRNHHALPLLGPVTRRPTTAS